MCGLSKGISMKYGVNAGIVAQLLWEMYHEETDTVTYNGQKWVRCSARLMTGHLPFMSEKMIRRAVDILVKNMVVRKDQLDRKKYDHTNWYAFTPYGMRMMRI